MEQRDLSVAEAMLDESMFYLKGVEPTFWEAQFQLVRGLLATHRRDFNLARICMEDALAQFVAIGEPTWPPYILKNLGRVAYLAGDRGEAEALFARALARMREMNNAFGAATTLINMAKAARDRGDLRGAIAHYSEALTLRMDLGDRVVLAGCLRGLARVAALLHQHERASRLYGALESLNELRGSATPPSSSQQRTIASLRDTLGEAAFEQAWSAGRAMPLAEAISEALTVQAPEADLPRQSAFGLTEREQEILHLVVNGRSNPEIAETLFISRRTVTTHLTNLFAKLGVTNRAEAIDLAHRRGLLDLVDRTTT
jgi:ATP/maltotriose-dependent transcriptional regulator MalT